jgi:hypothetical protein
MHKLGKHAITTNGDASIFICQQISIFDRRFITNFDALIAVITQIDFAGMVETILTNFDPLITAINADLAFGHHATAANREAVITPFDQNIDLLHAQSFCKCNVDAVARLDAYAIAVNPVMHKQLAAL